jgi:hypothetical protein
MAPAMCFPSMVHEQLAIVMVTADGANWPKGFFGGCDQPPARHHALPARACREQCRRTMRSGSAGPRARRSCPHELTTYHLWCTRRPIGGSDQQTSGLTLRGSVARRRLCRRARQRFLSPILGLAEQAHPGSPEPTAGRGNGLIHTRNPRLQPSASRMSGYQDRAESDFKLVN